MFILKQLRRKKNISQTNLAEAIGVSLRTIQLYEKKNANIPIKNLTKIARFFELTIGQLYSQDVNESEMPYERKNIESKKLHSIKKLAPGKYLLSVPLVTSLDENGFSLEDLVFTQELPRVGFVVEQVSVSNYLAFEIINDSMNDDKGDAIPQGSIVLGKQMSKNELKNRIKAVESFNCIIVYEGTVMCKQVISYDKKSNSILCHSLNDSPEYPDFHLDLNNIMGLFSILKKQVN